MLLHLSLSTLLVEKGRNNVLVGLPDLAKERKLSKIVINLRIPIFDIPCLFLSKGDILHFLQI